MYSKSYNENLPPYQMLPITKTLPAAAFPLNNFAFFRDIKGILFNSIKATVIGQPLHRNSKHNR